MCGIFGIVKLNGEFVNPEEIKRGINLLVHRGPDDKGIYTDGPIGLGHTRLSIIDLSRNARQPLRNEDASMYLVFNGEIYNFKSLKNILKKKGHTFLSRSDAEVVIHGYEEWGENILSYLNGMFAFAIFDKKDRKLFLARDRVGKKPLYYSLNEKRFIFASELKALLNINNSNFSINSQALYNYLTFGYIPGPQTIYKNIYEIPPSHYFIIKNNRINKYEYWNITYDKKRKINFHDAINEIDYLLKEAVKCRLISDVPIGIFLSGGIDSGLITALTSRLSENPVKTLTVSFDDTDFDESLLAKKVSNLYRTKHIEIKISPNIKKDLPFIVKAYDEPFADPSAIPSYFVAKEAKKYVKVILNGDGGDEIFGGYRRHLAIKLLDKSKYIFNSIPKKWAILLINSLPVPKDFRSSYAFLHRFLRGAFQDPSERYISWCMDGFTQIEKQYLYEDFPYKYFNSEIELLNQKIINNTLSLDDFMILDYKLNLPDCLLVKMDIATMAHGLEARSPFLDYRIAEWASRLNSNIKMKGFRTKPVLRELAKQYLPKAIVFAPKRGFEIPLIKWLRNDLKEMVWDICLDPNGIIKELFNKGYVENLLNEKINIDPGRWSKRVWILFMLAMWNKYIYREIRSHHNNIL